jgi:hypothetical protein
MIVDESTVIPMIDVKPVTTSNSYVWVPGANFTPNPLPDTYIPLYKIIFGDKP